MNSARSAGWACVGWAVAWAASALFCLLVGRGMAGAAWPGSLLAYPCYVIAGICALGFVFCALYAAWGLACGYSPRSWKSYCDDQREAEEKSLRALR